jgi:hypothetical protein
MELIISKHARERLTTRLGSPEIAPRLMDLLREAGDAGAGDYILDNGGRGWERI